MITKKLPTLYHQGKKKKLFSWVCWTENCHILTEYGSDDGKKQTTSKEVVGKNIGKANETTPEEQAELEAKSMWQAKLDRKYRLTVEEAMKQLPLPMLAKNFDKEKKKVTYPCDLQPKLDGVRCLAQWVDDHVELTSRSGKPYNCPHISTEIERVLPKGTILDGELYKHGETFQQVTRLVKKVRPESKGLSLWVYDIVHTDYMEAAWTTRKSWLGDFFVKAGDVKHLVMVTSRRATSEQHVLDLQAEYIQEGYEGAIVRTAEGIYRWGYRSSALLKVKTFQDEEFKVVGYKSGVGKFKDACIWWCITKEGGKTFDVVSKGTMEYRRELYDNAESYMGRFLKVKYFEKTEAGIPRFPIGIGFRLKEDS